jgi:hypothetical protein
MAQTLKINGVTYNEVKEITIPLASDPDTLVVFPNTDDANAAAGSIKDGETAYVKGEKITGTMPVVGAGGGKISAKDGSVKISEGYYDGTGSVAIADSEKAKIVANNIRQGVTILGVVGSMSTTEGLNPQAKEVTPTKSEQVVLPDNGYNALSQVTVEAIPAQYITTTDANAAATDIVKGKTAYVNGKKVTGSHTDAAFTLANGVLSIV